MERKDELKEINIDNRTYYYFGDIIRFWDRDIEFRDIILEEKSYERYENILIYDISCNTSTDAKPLQIRFDKVDEFYKTHNRFTCLVLFDYGWFDKICDKIKYLEKAILQIILIIILQKSEFIHMILYLLKKY